MAVIERVVRIANRNGLHARPASEFVKLASKFASEISVGKDDMWVNGKSIMGVMTLAAEYGSTVKLRAEGEDAAEAVAALARCLGRVWRDEELAEADGGEAAG